MDGVVKILYQLGHADFPELDDKEPDKGQKVEEDLSLEKQIRVYRLHTEAETINKRDRRNDDDVQNTNFAIEI
jgi:hypothetical protein